MARGQEKPCLFRQREMQDKKEEYRFLVPHYERMITGLHSLMAVNDFFESKGDHSEDRAAERIRLKEMIRQYELDIIYMEHYLLTLN